MSIRRLKILMILPYSPFPVYTGGAGRIFQKIKYFGERHEVTVACFYGSSTTRKKVTSKLSPYCKNIYTVKNQKINFLKYTKIPEKVSRRTSLKMWITLSRIRDNFDIVMFEHIFVSLYRHLFKDSYTIIEEHNIESKLLFQSSEINNKNNDQTCQSNILKNFEIQQWPLFDLRTTVSQVDADYISSYCNKEIKVVENGVMLGKPQLDVQSKKILFMGHLNYEPNIQGLEYFIEKIFPDLLSIDNEFELYVAGHEPSQAVLNICNNKKVTCIADPENMNDIGKECLLSIVPLVSGSGTRIKILQSFAMNLPVISTTIGCEGLSVLNGEHLIICDNNDEFLSAIIKVHNDHNLRKRLIKNGRKLIEDRYNWKMVFSDYEKFLLNKMH